MVYKKFEKIRLRIIKGRQLLPFPTAAVLQDHEDRLAALEAESSSDEGEKTTYNFVTYADAEGTTEWGEGTVESTGVVKGNYSEVVIKTNSPDESYVGQKFFLRTTAKTDGTIYAVYKDAGRTKAGFYVSISTS